MHKKSISFISFTRYLHTFHNDRADSKCTAINNSRRPQKTSKRPLKNL